MQPVKAPSQTEVAAGHEKNGIHTVDSILSPIDTSFPSLCDLEEHVEHLQHELAIARPDQKLSGRIIQVVYSLPFTIKPLSEYKYLEQKVEAQAAADTVAQLAAQARARRAEREAREREAEENMQQKALHEQQLNDSQKVRTRSFGAEQPQRLAMSSVVFNGVDLEKSLQENQERSKQRAGRKAWFWEAGTSDDEYSERDRFSPVGSFVSSVGSVADAIPEWVEQGTGLSELASPPSPTPRSPLDDRPPWILCMHRGHSALNGGIQSLCDRYRQTYIATPTQFQFAVNAERDMRMYAGQTTSAERVTVESVLASLEDRQAWSQHEGGLSVRPASMPQQAQDSMHGIKYVPVWLDQHTAFAHYDAYCKTTLWPLFHYMMWRDDEDRSSWDQYSWNAYVQVNQAFAQQVVSEYQQGDIVWVHDYHLLLVPLFVRRAIPDAHIGLFIHSAFPSSEIFRCLPQRNEILEGMLGTDLTCFQNNSYARHFVSCCVRIGGLEVQGSTVESPNGRVTQVSHNTVGVDVERVHYEATSPQVQPRMQQLRDLYAEQCIIVGCDKLDVVHGVIQKLQAFYDLLLHYPQWREKVVLIQITVPASTTSTKLERQVSELVSQINGDFGSLSFTPVQHYHQVIDRSEYYALLSVADLALVTSVRDGMNTMSMEYVVCQHAYQQRPLILSEFTGTAGHLPAAIKINPWDIGGVAAAIHHALAIRDSERRERHQQCYEQVMSRTSRTWALSLVHQMLLRLRHRYSAHSTSTFDTHRMLQHYGPAKKRLLLLDYDGTLTPIVKDPAAAVPSKRLLEAMRTLSENPKNAVYIISGRDEAFLTKHFGGLPAVGLSAEHGSYFKEHGAESRWQNLSEELDMSWKDDVLNVFRYFTDRTIGSNIEEKKSSIVWHYRNADPDFGSFQAKECQSLLDNILSQNDLQVEVVVGKKNVEVRPLAINKGEIVHRILFHNPDTDFVYCAGDDKTDEDMFRFLSQLAFEIDDPTPGASCVTLPPPAPLRRSAEREAPARKVCIRPEQVYTTTVGPSSKRTRAGWHVGEPWDIVDALAMMAQADGASITQDKSHAVEPRKS
ncbi:hypothetical protein MNAN1_001134 [Malassezia nana]|uniref:Trehalose-phosphatase n=1 Tax=Malassezia nana TaxID=180528 RepID=A0AAF0EIH8_9BASI|nr:hypothetical protein MNAN1_001134 [Malassezia nana]